MPLSFATKLRLALLWPALAAVLVAGLMLAWLLPHRVEESVSAQLVQTAELLAPLVAEHVAHDTGPLQPWVRNLAVGSQLRVTVIRGEGTVLADSTRTDDQLARMENHAARPEVRAALADGSGHSVRRSATTGVSYAYAARTVRPPHGPLLIVRVAEPLREIAVLERHLSRAAIIALLVALVATAMLSWWLGRRLFQPLAAMIGGADRLATGPGVPPLLLPGQPELRGLAASINRLAARAEQQLAATERERDHLRSILASMAEGVLVTDERGRALLANAAFQRLFGVPAAVEGRLPIEIVRVPALHDVVQQAILGQTIETQQVVLDHPQRRYAALAAAPLGPPGTAGGGAVVVARDVTPFVRLEEVRRDFVANVSHELKTPLAAIRGLAETLRDGALSDAEAGPRFVARILEQCRRLEALLADLLTLARLESPAARQEPAELDLAELARHSAEMIVPLAVEKQVTVSVDAVEPTTLRGDADALERLLLNLLENAVKYNRPGGTVTLRVHGEDGAVALEVRDSGIGIPPDQVTRIFERFYRVDRGRSRAEGGTGLGLAIVKHVAQLHGGSVEVASTPGEGSSFKVRLPLDR